MGAVEVTSDGSVVNVYVAMNSTGYTAPSLPASTPVTWSKEDLEKANPDVKSQFDEVDFWANLKLLVGGTWGVVGRRPDPLRHVERSGPADASAVVDVSAGNIPAGQGVTTNDSQPYPVMVWLETEWWVSSPVSKPTADVFGG